MLFQSFTCFEQPRAHHQKNQLYQYSFWYMSLYVRGHLVCRSRRNSYFFRLSSQASLAKSSIRLEFWHHRHPPKTDVWEFVQAFSVIKFQKRVWSSLWQYSVPHVATLVKAPWMKSFQREDKCHEWKKTHKALIPRTVRSAKLPIEMRASLSKITQHSRQMILTT
jgi:hypothetical protein